jgi:hypothetical protein
MKNQGKDSVIIIIIIIEDPKRFPLGEKIGMKYLGYTWPIKLLNDIAVRNRGNHVVIEVSPKFFQLRILI